MTCSTPDCGRTVYARGLCHRCYDAQRPGRAPSGRRARPGVNVGSVEVEMDRELLLGVLAAAESAGLPTAEWCRRVMRAALGIG